MFEYAVYENAHPICQLASVCRRWRQVIWSSSSLWISVFLCPRQPGVWELFDLHLENAKDLSNFIHLPTDHGLGAALKSILELLRAAFIRCPDKTRALDLGPMDGSVWDVLTPCSARTEFPRLEVVKLNFKRGFEGTFEGNMFHYSSHLRSIDMTEPFHGIEGCPPLHQITSLSHDRLSLAYSLYVIETLALHNFHTLRRWEGDIPPSATFIIGIQLRPEPILARPF
ncbi:hypothetical protein D9756_002818 [Leucocoprinus leucothites]|uniref:F-box domain-containing protein n=1 Tax=Leucocoprinus leucothites TaxID=201217 RepID=A0A8H5GB99_9AGAR|nr:hypothetical protein D9756_002818 [Leucoagaricus leucothites]